MDGVLSCVHTVDCILYTCSEYTRCQYVLNSQIWYMRFVVYMHIQYTLALALIRSPVLPVHCRFSVVVLVLWRSVRRTGMRVTANLKCERHTFARRWPKLRTASANINRDINLEGANTGGGTLAPPCGQGINAEHIQVGVLSMHGDIVTRSVL